VTENGQPNQPPSLHANLMGEVRISAGGRLIADDAWSLRSARSLLLLLLITRGHSIPKERVLDILWPESGPEVARNALYKALHLLRRVLEPNLVSARHSAYIETRGGMIGIAPTVEIWVDADECERHLRAARGAAPEERRQPLRLAVSLYKGELLPTDPYEDWPVARRESLRQAWESAVLDLAELDLEANEPQASVPPLELLLTLDPTLEAAHRALMRGYVAAGQRDRALRQYERCVAAIENELGLPPERETQALFAAIKATPAEKPSQPAVVSGPFNNLPTPPTPIVGRDREIDILTGTLWRQDVRLVTLTGPGGVGKTRLAIEVASRLVDDYADGIAFVPLAAVRDAGLVLQTISSTLGLNDESGSSPAVTLTSWLRSREMVLVLDNFEQILDAATDIGSLLANCPSLTVLVTSRERLQLRGEHLHEVPPLAVPRPDRLPSAPMLARYGSVVLFSQHMQRIDPEFEVTPENSEIIGAICSHLEGLPLAIELATAGARFYSLESLRDRFSSRMDIEEGLRDLPARQRTLRATFDWSYDLLTDDEKTVFRQLGSAIGGLSLESAESICGVSVSRVRIHLHSLAEKHLIRWERTDAGPRITMLETIREYAMERLQDSGEDQEIRDRHAEHFLSLATEAESHIVGTDQLVWFDRLETEQGNLRAAFSWAIPRPGELGTLVARAATSLWRYWWRRGLLTEGISWLERALTRAERASQLRAHMLLSLARMYEVQSDYTRAEALINEALPISEQFNDRPRIAKALSALGEIAEDRGDLSQASDLYHRALAIYREFNQEREIAATLNKLATVAYYQGNSALASHLWEESASIFRELGDHWAVSVLLGNLGAAAMARGDIHRAVSLHEENLSIARQLKDPGSIGRALCNLAEAMQLRGDVNTDSLLEEALTLQREMKNKQFEITALTLIANNAMSAGETKRAARLYGSSLALCEEIGDRATMANIALLERIAMLGMITGQYENAARVLGASQGIRSELGTPLMSYLAPTVERCLESINALPGADDIQSLRKHSGTMSFDATMVTAHAVCDHAVASSDRQVFHSTMVR